MNEYEADDIRYTLHPSPTFPLTHVRHKVSGSLSPVQRQTPSMQSPRPLQSLELEQAEKMDFSTLLEK